MKVVIDYTNHRGERAKRTIIPLDLKWTTSPFHGNTVQHFIKAFDLDRQAVRLFACKDIHGWESAT